MLRRYNFVRTAFQTNLTISDKGTRNYSVERPRERTTIMNDATNPFFNNTTHRWLYNEHLRLAERRLCFDMNELCRIMARAAGLPQNDLILVTKLAEGGSFRIFEASFRNGLKTVARLPYPCTIPHKYGVASEVATMEFLRIHGLPIPKILEWSSSALNKLGSEYIIMERVSGKALADTWHTMTLNQRMAIVEKIVAIESRLFDIKFPVSGSIYFKDFMEPGIARVDMPNDPNHEESHRYCIGPSTEYLWWYQNRHDLGANGGPWHRSQDVLTAIGEREILWLQKFGKKQHPRVPFYREVYGRKKVDPQLQIQRLVEYLKFVPYLAPEGEELNRPIIRHPDLSPNNILISDSGDVTGVIDWQHATVLPLFLQAKIPEHFQNYGDDDSENFRPPKLVDNFDNLTIDEKEAEQERYRRRQVHYFYLGYTQKLNKPHFNALERHSLVLRNQLYNVAGRPWEGDTTSLHAQLIKTVANWSEIAGPEDKPPVLYSPAEIEDCLNREAEQNDIDEQIQRIRECIGVSIDGLVVDEELEGARQRARTIQSELIRGANTEEEKREFQDLWPYQDHEEEED